MEIEKILSADVLKGKVSIVKGAGRGLGRTLALALAPGPGAISCSRLVIGKRLNTRRRNSNQRPPITPEKVP